MTSTLYLLRQHPDLISSSLFRASDRDMDIIFIEQTSFMLSSTVKGSLVSTMETEAGLSHPTMTYDELIEKIFSSKHIIVV